MDEKAESNSLVELTRLLSPLLQDEELQLLLLFGSVAAGMSRRRSDIDLAFLFDQPADVIHLTNKVIQLLHTDKVDVVDLRRASPLLAFSAVKQGRIIYERAPGIFNVFYSLSFRRYADTEKLRRAQYRAIQSFLEGRRER